MSDHSAHYYINKTFLETVETYKTEGMGDLEIAKHILSGSPTIKENTQYLKALRSVVAIAKSEVRAEEEHLARAMNARGYSNAAIAEDLGISQSTVRSLLKDA